MKRHINVAILISGNGTNMEALIRSMAGERLIWPALVISSTSAAYANGLKIAESLGVRTEVVDYFNKQKFENKIHSLLLEYNIDIICLAGFMKVLSADFVSKWKDKILNIHPSLLPKYKGLNPHQKALDAGDAKSGCTVHIVTEEVDSGQIIMQSLVEIKEDDTVELLQQRILHEEYIVYPLSLAIHIHRMYSHLFKE
jgi:phosphoribosylglycinamide formyltransferase-1